MTARESVAYRGWTITARTFQVRTSGRWTLDLVIAYRTTQRAFSGSRTFRTQQAAVRGCHAFGRRIIDGLVPFCTVEGLR